MFSNGPKNGRKKKFKILQKNLHRRSERSRHNSGHSRHSRSQAKSNHDITDLSPLSPDRPDAVSTDGNTMQLPVKMQPPETVILQKGKMSKISYGLRLGTRIYIQDVQPGSLADQQRLKAGDVVLKINGQPVDNKTVNEAIQARGLKKDIFLRRTVHVFLTLR
mgnify:CR=1 FL=1